MGDGKAIAEALLKAGSAVALCEILESDLKRTIKSLARDLARYGIRINYIGLGYFKTFMTQGRWEDQMKNKECCNSTLLGRWESRKI